MEETIDAAIAWRTLSALEVERVPGSSDDRHDFLISKSGDPFTLPFARKGNRSKYLKRAFDEVVEQLISSS
jgi:hypothetical protein